MKRIILTATLACLLTRSAWASVPAGFPPKNAAEAYAQADVVFLGEVKAVAKDDLGFASQAQVKVLRVFKGKPGTLVMVSGQGGTTYPARIFKPGERLLFYLGADLHADAALNRVLPAAEAKKDFVYLRLHHP